MNSTMEISNPENLIRLKDNFDWFYSHYDQYKKYCSNRFIAVRDKKCIDYDKNLEDLVKRLKIQEYNNSIVIEFVNP